MKSCFGPMLLIILGSFIIISWVMIYKTNYSVIHLNQKIHGITSNNDTKDWERTNKLREYVYLNSPWSSPSLSIKNEIWNKNTKEIFNLYKTKIGGIDCSGIATTLMKLYDENGYEAYAYHSGKLNSSFTHVVTLVRINYKNSKKLILQDPTFNVTYVDMNGEPLDFYQMLRFIKNKEYDKFKIFKTNNLLHLYFCSEEDRNKKLCGIFNPETKIKKLGGNIISYNEEAFIETLTEYIQVYLDETDINSSNRIKYPEENILVNIRKIFEEEK